MTTFGPVWTQTLIDGARVLAVPPAWVLAVIALESGFNPTARNPSGAVGLWQKMPEAGRPYSVTDPVEQLRDAFRFWRSMVKMMNVGAVKSREAFYCLNLAPARLKDGNYDDETILYAAPGPSYQQNAEAFGLVKNDPHGALRLRHLAYGLNVAVRRCQARYDDELVAAVPTQWLGTAEQPDMRDPNLSEPHK